MNKWSTNEKSLSKSVPMEEDQNPTQVIEEAMADWDIDEKECVEEPVKCQPGLRISCHGGHPGREKAIAVVCNATHQERVDLIKHSRVHLGTLPSTRMGKELFKALSTPRASKPSPGASLGPQGSSTC